MCSVVPASTVHMKKRQIQPGAVSQKDWAEIWKKKTDAAEEERCPTRTPKQRVQLKSIYITQYTREAPVMPPGKEQS